MPPGTSPSSSAIPVRASRSSNVPNPLEGENVFKSSGRGVFLINQLMDEVAFADGGREVQMRKKRAIRIEEEKTGT